MLGLALVAYTFLPRTLEVGPGKEFLRIEEAVKIARKGDEVHVFADAKGYPGTTVRLTVPITIRGIGSIPIPIQGNGFDYSGVGSVPRAIIQIEPSASGAKIENLDLSGAHNQSFNGAGIRIQAANDVTISDCVIHDNDMGIMSNGKEGDPKAGSNQLIQYCLIEKNGNVKDPGYNHNLYLGGTSVRVSHCEIRNSTTGHNLKSRAHFILVDYCWIHDAANREIDLPEAWDTQRPNSNAVLLGNRIIKDASCVGNRGVIHFGREKGSRVGQIFLLGNVLVTPFQSPVVAVTSDGSTIVAKNNTFLNTESRTAELWTGAAKILASGNRVSLAYGSLGGTNLTGSVHSDTFGLSPGTFIPKDVGKDKSDLFEWIDGEGRAISFMRPTRKTSSPQTTDEEFATGPRRK